MLLTSVENVKQFLGINISDDDALLDALVTQASAYIEQWISRSVGLNEYTDVFDGYGKTTYMFTNFPAQSVSHVYVNDIEIFPSTGVTDSGYIFDETRLVLRGSKYFVQGQMNCSVTYMAGYATVPNELVIICTELVAFHYKQRERIGVTSKNLGGETISFSQENIPPAVKAIMINWRKVVPT